MSVAWLRKPIRSPSECDTGRRLVATVRRSPSRTARSGHPVDHADGYGGDGRADNRAGLHNPGPVDSGVSDEAPAIVPSQDPVLATHQALPTLISIRRTMVVA